MKTQEYTALIRRCRSGDAAARKKLLMESYMQISYQCRHILLVQSAAEPMTRDILNGLNRELNSMQKPECYLERMQELIAQRTVEYCQQRNAAAKPIQLQGKLLDEHQTAELIVSLVDGLPWEQRLCAVLLACGNVGADRISIYTGIPVQTVKEHLRQVEQAVSQRLEEYRQQGIKLLGAGRFELMFQCSMESRRNEMTAAAVAETVMGTIRPHGMQRSAGQAANKTARKNHTQKNKSKLIALIIVLFILLLAAVGYAIYLEKQHEDDWMLRSGYAITEEFRESVPI